MSRKRTYRPGTTLTVGQMVEIARGAVQSAGGQSAVAVRLGVSRQAVHAALGGESRNHALLERIVREIGSVSIGEAETVKMWRVEP